jgi:hypothetical protein
MSVNGNGARLRGEGVVIEFADGVSRRIYFSLRAKHELEEVWGSLDAYVRLLDPKNRTFKGKRIAVLESGLAAGLLDYWYRAADSRNQERPSREERLDRLESIVSSDPKDVERYFEAITAALAQAIPPPRNGDAAPDDDDPNSSAADSPGPASTTSEPSVMAGATRSSGG